MDLSTHWKSIVDLLQDGVMVVDFLGTVVAVNPAAERMTGYQERELVGKSCRLLDCTGCKIIGKGPGKQWCGLFEKGEVRAKKCLITNKDRRVVSVIKNATILHDQQGQIIGAVETLTDISQLVRQQQEIANLRRSLHMDDGYHGILGKSPQMLTLYELIENVAKTDSPVLVLGESGTGKELVARAIHDASGRRDQPFVKVNCAALNENLLESELFGHTKGAYTGADRNRVGRFEAAHGGTIFLDEIGDIPLATQVKLLRVLEEKEIERVGDHRPVRVDVRIISATNKDLDAAILKGEFREDLYFRINVFPLQCPPLSQRRTDIPLIIQHFIRENNDKSGKQISGLAPAAMEKIIWYDWPGNVRELRNAIEYAFVLCNGQVIEADHLPPKILGSPPECRPAQQATEPVQTKDDARRQDLLTALRRAGGNQSEAARQLGVSRVTVWKQMKKYGIDLKRDLVLQNGSTPQATEQDFE